jgi:Spy/CpxP family protein refolding chaperone
MLMWKVSLALTGALIVGLNMPAVFAQEADESGDSAMIEVAEQALGIATPDNAVMSALANLPVPDSAVFAALNAQGDDGAAVQIAEGGPEHHGGEGGPGGHWGHEGGRGRGPFGALQGALALTDDQYEKLYAIKNDTSDATASKRMALHQSTRGLMESLGQADQDGAKISRLQSQIASLKSDLSTAETGKLVRMSQVLTADQRKALRMAMIKASLCHHHGGHGGHH